MEHHYYVNDEPQNSGDHEVHREGCSYFPFKYCTYLGYFSNCREAITKAKEHYLNVDGCYTCSRDCHSRQTNSAHSMKLDSASGD